MKAADLRDLSDDDLARALAERRQELFNLRFQSATGALENPARLKLAGHKLPIRTKVVRREGAGEESS